jgi:hypothetical protein
VDVEPERGSPTPEEAGAFDATSAGRDVTLAAVRRLEAAAARAGTGREVDWLDQVVADLALLDRAVSAERTDSLRPDSLLSMIAHDYPRRFGSRVRQLREQQDDIYQAIGSLREQLTSMSNDPTIDVPDLRHRLGRLTDAIRHRWGREADLVYEAIRLDLGRADHAAQLPD